MLATRATTFKSTIDAQDVYQILVNKSSCDDPSAARQEYLKKLGNSPERLELLKATRDLALAKFIAEDSMLPVDGANKSTLCLEILGDVKIIVDMAMAANELDEAKSMAFGI